MATKVYFHLPGLRQNFVLNMIFQLEVMFLYGIPKLQLGFSKKNMNKMENG